MSETDLVDDRGLLVSSTTREVARSPDRYGRLIRALAESEEGQRIRTHLYPRIEEIVHDFGGSVLLTAFECGEDLCTLSFKAPDQFTSDSFVLAFGEKERFFDGLRSTDVYDTNGHVVRVFFTVLDEFRPQHQR